MGSMRKKDGKRDIWDLRFGRKGRSDEIAPAAYSRDGYLINQGLLSGVTYGRRTTRETGCGWIACFNFLKCMGRPEPPLQVARGMEKMLLWGGCIGSHPLAVWWYLHRRGFRFRVAFTRCGMERSLKNSPKRTAGVIAYWHGKGAHYVTFVREETQEMAQEVPQNTMGVQTVTQTVTQTVPGTAACSHGRLRYLNAVYGAGNHRLTPKEFFKKYVKCPLCFVIVAK